MLIDPGATQEIRENLIRQYGLDQPLWRQCLTFLGNVVPGDLDRSMVYTTSFTGLVFSRLSATVELVLVSVTIATCVGIPAGIYAGCRPDSLGAKAILALSVLGFSVPTFWIGIAAHHGPRGSVRLAALGRAR